MHGQASTHLVSQMLQAVVSGSARLAARAPAARSGPRGALVQGGAAAAGGGADAAALGDEEDWRVGANGRDSIGRRLGLKKSGGQAVAPETSSCDNAGKVPPRRRRRHGQGSHYLCDAGWVRHVLEEPVHHNRHKMRQFVHVSPQDPNELAEQCMRSSARPLKLNKPPTSAARPSLRFVIRKMRLNIFFCAIESSLGSRDMNLSHAISLMPSQLRLTRGILQ